MERIQRTLSNRSQKTVDYNEGIEVFTTLYNSRLQWYIKSLVKNYPKGQTYKDDILNQAYIEFHNWLIKNQGKSLEYEYISIICRIIKTLFLQVVFRNYVLGTQRSELLLVDEHFPTRSTEDELKPLSNQAELINSYHPEMTIHNFESELRNRLTPAEEEVFDLWLEHRDFKIIAKARQVSLGTVRALKKNINRKTQLVGKLLSIPYTSTKTGRTL